MKIPTISEILKSRLLVAGLVFFSVNAWYTYSFYQVNSFKILMVLIGVSVLAVWYDLLFPQNTEKSIPWKVLVIAAIPLLVTLPGIAWYQGNYNYNFRYELTSYLVLIVWVAYLYRGVNKKDDLNSFLFLVGITVIYAGVLAMLERIGYSPFAWGAGPVSRVKSTFGNINYFAGFLVVLIPLLLSLCLPQKFPDSFSIKNLAPNTIKSLNFYVIVFLIAFISLVLTETRAAQGATFVSLVVVFFFYIFAFINTKYRKYVLITGISLVILGLLILLLLFVFREYLPENRYTRLLFLEGWTPRFAGWIPAINSIQASPLIGYGLGSSYNLYFAFTDPNSRLIHAEHSYNHVHSEFLEYTQEGGIIGLAVFIIFWGFIAFKVFKVLNSDQHDPILRNIAIGIVGGFVGYHLQSAFSVAPRMMVVKLPLFTLIGLTFIVSRLANKSEVFETNRGLLNRLKSFAPAFVVAGFCWLIFTPWLIGQYKFVKIRSSRPSLLMVEELEKTVKKYPDAYALDHLSHLQIQYNRPSQLQETVNLIDKVLPRYRELGHTKAFLAVMQRDLKKAKQLALEYQETQDRYHSSTINLLMSIALETDDFQLFQRQFELFTRRLVFESRLYYGLQASAVQVIFSSMDLPFEIEEKDNQFNFRWNERLVKGIFDIRNTLKTKGSFTEKDRNSFVSFLSFQIGRHPYFQIQLKPAYKNEGMNQINQRIRDYFITAQQSSKIAKELSEKHQRALMMARLDDRAALEDQQELERLQVLKPYQDKMKEISDYLNQRTDWERYQQKRNFAQSFIQELVNVVFPQIKPA